ncbi:protein phosphatase 1 regulatory subunit 3A [Hyla sarda]|uniref:protein phosphatase 1 regulatory subunit 3A n=1 Tax=Hyla sarda TaxID=327740 RepID=UPI0024C271D0|nr:protein phosphatase 1 regulatory subunit 3A [Hyla sarda]
MERFEESNASKDNLLEPTSLYDSTTDEEDVKATIKPRLSPLPRRRSSVSSDDGDLEPPPTVARKVSFADAFGFDLVSVKEFDTWEIPIVTPSFAMESIKIEEFYLTPSFILPPVGGIMEKVHAKKVTLESVDFIPGVSSMKGIIRVLNVSFEKQVYVRMSLDDWHSHYDILAEYLPDSCNGETDQFFFTLSLVSPYQKEGAKVVFCICYETAVGTFWDNNDGQNYVLTCQKKEQIVEVDMVPDEEIDKNKKSCLKPSLSKEDEESDVFQAEIPAATEKFIPRIICSHDDFSENNNSEEKEDTSEEKNNEDESDVQLFLSQRLMNARITSGFSEKAILPNDQQVDERNEYLKNMYSGTSDSQQLEECDESGEYLPFTEVTPCKDTKDFIYLLSSDHHSGQYQELTKTQECLDGSEETDLYEHDSEINELEKISPVIIDEVSYREPSLRSSSREQSEDFLSDSCLKISETPCIVQADTMQLTDIEEVLDDNANPNFSHSIVTLPYFSTQDTKGIKDEQSEKNKSETIENDTLPPVTTEHTEQEHLILFSQKDDFQNPLYNSESSSSNVIEKENTEPNEKVCSFTSSGDTFLFSEGKARDIREDETAQNTNLTASLSKDTKQVDDETNLSGDKQYITTRKDKEIPYSDITTASLSKKYYLTDPDSQGDQVHENIQVTDDKDVTSETGDHRDKDVRAVYDSEKESTVLDFSPSIACTAAQYVSQSTLHEWNAKLGSLPSEQTQAHKVIIAKITEEKGQSQRGSQDRQGSKGSYMDIGYSENESTQQGMDEKSEQKVTSASGSNIELIKENMLETSDISHISTEDVHYWGVTYISKGQNELEHYDGRSNGLVGQSAVEYDVPGTLFTSGNTKLGQNLNGRSEEDVAAKKETVDFTEPSQLVITEDKENVDNVQANMEKRSFQSILISEPHDEGNAQRSEAEHRELEDTQYYPHDDQTTSLDQQTGTIVTEPMNMGHISSKVLCFLMFVVFAGLMYHFDFLVCFGLYLFSLYWLYWEGGRNKNPVKKE